MAGNELSPMDAAAFRVMAVIALLLGAVSLYFGVARAIDAVIRRSATVDLDLVNPQDVAGASVETVTLLARDFGSGAGALLAAGAILGGLIASTVAVAIALFLWRLAQGRPFIAPSSRRRSSPVPPWPSAGWWPRS